MLIFPSICGSSGEASRARAVVVGDARELRPGVPSPFERSRALVERCDDERGVASDETRGEPRGNVASDGERDGERRDEDLVARGVEVRPRDGSLVPSTGEVAVEPVADGRGEHAGEHERGVGVVKHGARERGPREAARDGQAVGHGRDVRERPGRGGRRYGPGGESVRGGRRRGIGRRRDDGSREAAVEPSRGGGDGGDGGDGEDGDAADEGGERADTGVRASRGRDEAVAPPAEDARRRARARVRAHHLARDERRSAVRAHVASRARSGRGREG